MTSSSYERRKESKFKHENAKAFTNVLDITSKGIIKLKSNQVARLYFVEAVDISLSSSIEQESFYFQLRSLYMLKNLNLKMYKLEKELDLNAIEEKLNYTIIEKSNDEKRSYLLQDQADTLSFFKNSDNRKSSRYYWVVIANNETKLDEICQDVESICSSLSNPIYLTKVENQLLVKQFLQELYFQNCNLGELVYNDLYDTIVPHTIVETPNYLKIDNYFVQMVSIKRLSSKVYKDFLDGVFNTPQAKASLSIYDNFDTQKFISTLDYNYRSLISDRRTTKKLSDVAELDEQNEAMQILMSDLKTGNEQLKTFTLVLALYADSEKKLKQIWKDLKSYSSQSSVQLDICRYRQLEAWQTFDLTTYNFQNYTRPLPTLSIAASFPLTRSYFLDSNGFYLGYDVVSGLPIYYDPFFLSQTRINNNIALIGSSGSGKSFTLKKLLINEYAKGCKLFILDVENEYGNLVRKNGGHFINLYSREGGMINPLQIRLMASDNDESTDFNEIKDSPLAKHLGFLEAFFESSFNELTETQWICLSQIIEELYGRFGITNQTTVEQLELLNNKSYPTFDDLMKLIIEKKNQDYGLERNALISQLDVLISRFVHGIDGQLFNGHTNIDLNNDIICFNIQELLASKNARLISTQIVSLLTYLNSIIISNKNQNQRLKNNLVLPKIKKKANQQNVIIAADEFHVFAEYPDVLKFLSQICRRVRKYSGSFIFATQSIQDLLGSDNVVKYARAIFNNCQYQLIGKLKEDDFTAYKNLFKDNPLTDTQEKFLTTSVLGQFLVTIDSKRRLLVNVDATEIEQEYMGEKERKTTDH